jgi:chemotaxis protein CheC
MGLSMMNEVSNIAAASFIKAVADMTGMKINIAPPSSTIDMVGAIMNVPAVYFANISDNILLMENRFDCGGVKANANVLLMLEVDSLERLMTKLGVEI